tara:strand:- start:1078 stop:1311 length:234 start_codon:yes stop_codon:yes gene_type:complete
MKVTVKYLNRVLLIEGEIRDAEPEDGIFNESFDVIEMKCDDVHVHDDYDEDDYYEIVKLCLIQAKEDKQTDWEIANV